VTRERIVQWQEAYAHRGTGSTKVPRRDIEGIYEEAAPIPRHVPDRLTNEFLKDIRALIRDSIAAAGGMLEGLPNAGVSA
jgi:hypothetical protein